MQLAALSFAPNLLQNKAVGTKATLGSSSLTSSKADSFTPSAKIRQGNTGEPLEQKFMKLIAEKIPILDRVDKEGNQVLKALAHSLKQQWEDSNTRPLKYEDLMEERDELF